jgi:hypothetical protein
MKAFRGGLEGKQVRLVIYFKQKCSKYDFGRQVYDKQPRFSSHLQYFLWCKAGQLCYDLNDGGGMLGEMGRIMVPFSGPALQPLDQH